MASRTRALLEQRPAPDDAAGIERLVDELGVHQVELELQNEELLVAHARLEASRDRYLVKPVEPGAVLQLLQSIHLPPAVQHA
jgi:hypothetical protein